MNELKRSGVIDSQIRAVTNAQHDGLLQLIIEQRCAVSPGASRDVRRSRRERMDRCSPRHIPRRASLHVLAYGRDRFEHEPGLRLDRVRGDLDELAASVFLPGGPSRSTRISARVQACFPEIPLVHGDPSLGVVSGLAVAASEFGG